MAVLLNRHPPDDGHVASKLCANWHLLQDQFLGMGPTPHATRAPSQRHSENPAGEARARCHIVEWLASGPSVVLSTLQICLPGETEALADTAPTSRWRLWDCVSRIRLASRDAFRLHSVNDGVLTIPNRHGLQIDLKQCHHPDRPRNFPPLRLVSLPAVLTGPSPDGGWERHGYCISLFAGRPPI